MARTLHQAMAYLGLAENETERSQQASRRLEPVYEETVFEADDTYQPFDDEVVYEEPQAETSVTDDRDVLLGTLGNSRSGRPSESDDLHAPFQSSAASSLSADNYRDQDQSSAHSAPVERPANRYTPNESDEELRRITTIHPRSYNDAKIIGESFRENIPVIMNVTDMGDTDAKRLVDFSAGLAFALHGSIERVTDKVFLLTPANLEVLGAEGAEIPVALDSDDSNLFNQV